MLKGDLADFTMPDILRLLAFTTKTGHLRLHGDGDHGRVVVADGLVRDASADAQRLPLARRLIGRAMVDGVTLRELLTGRDTLLTDLELARELVARDLAEAEEVTAVLREQCVDAVFDLLRWPTGSFEFETRPAAAAGPPELALEVDELLAEAEARLVRWTTISERTGLGDAVVTVGRPAGGALQIDADGWQLLGLADGRRTVDDLAALSGRGQFDTRETLVGLIDLGVVAVGDAGGAGSIERLLADHRVLAELEPATGGPDVRASVEGDPGVDLPAAPVVPSGEVEPAAEVGPADATGPPLDHEPAEPAPLTVDDRELVTGPPAVSASTPGRGSAPAPAEPEPAVEEPVAAAVTPLRHHGRLRPDPTIDAELVGRLIDGVEGL